MSHDTQLVNDVADVTETAGGLKKLPGCRRAAAHRASVRMRAQAKEREEGRAIERGGWRDLFEE